MKKLTIILLLMLAVPAGLFAQTVTVTVGNGGPDYLNLQEAFDDINAGNITGDIILQLNNNSTQTGTAVLYPTGYLGNSDYTSITIYPVGSGYTISGNINLPLIELNGAANIIIDGRVNQSGLANLIITNTNTGALASTIKFIESANNNTVQYCIIKGAGTGASGGVISFSTASAGGGNDNILIDNNSITSDASGRPVNAIFSSGTSGRENSGNIISNNNLNNFLNKGVASNGISLNAFTTAWTISGNSFYETASFVPTASVAYNIIQINNTSGTGFNITGNYIGGTAAACGGIAWTKTNAFDNGFNAINLNVGTGTATSVQSNTISSFSWANSGAASWTAINIAAGDVNIGTVTGNTTGAPTGTGSISVIGGATGTIVSGIYITGAGTVNCQNNITGSITAANSGATFATNFYGIFKSSSAGNTTISGNIIGSTATANSINTSSASTGNIQSLFGISNDGTANVTISGNTIASLANGTTNSAGIVAGIYFNGSTGTNAVKGNFINSLTAAAGSTTASVYGINIAKGASTYSNNIISLGGNTQTTIYGIYESGGAGNNDNFYFNSLYLNGSPGAGSNNTYLFYSNTNTNTRDLRNNIFSNARSNSGATGKHYGIFINSTGGTLTCNYNDYYVSGTGGVMGYYGADKTVLPVVTGQDVNSLAINPLFANAGGTTASDYVPSETSLAGITGTSVTTDYNGAARGLTPTMGAFEAGVCTNPTSGGTIAGAQSGCSPFNPVAFTSSAPATGQIGPALEYMWQQSTTSSGAGFSDLSGSNSLTYDAGSLTQTTWFKRLARVSCMTDWTGAAETNAVMVTVNAQPVANAITGGNALCIGGALSLNSNATGTPTLTYIWTSSNTGVATVTNSGLVSPVSAGSTNITYKVTDGSSTACQANSPVQIVTVNSPPVANPVTGTHAVCMNGSLTLTSNATGTPVLTYTWNSTNTAVAIVDNTGIVTPVSVGSTNIRYTVTDGSSTSCSAISSPFAVTVNPVPVAGAITGANEVCMGGTVTLVSHATGTPVLTYTWLSSNPAVATVNTSGVVTPVAAGTTNITYTVTDGSVSSCQATSPVHAVTVNALPVAGAITGGTSVCMGGTLSLTSHATGTPVLTYTWGSSNPAVATVNNSGVVTPVSAGTTNITYTVTDGSATLCSAISSPLSVTVNPLPVAGAITGGNEVCMGSQITLTSHATGTPALIYSWTSTNTAVATVDNSGVVTPVSAGTTNISYTVTDGSATACQATSAVHAVTVNALPIAGSITGGSSVCMGGSLSLPAHATGTPVLSYIWTSSNPAVGTVSNSGIFTPVSAGVTNITYTVTDGSSTLCSAISPSFPVTVNALPATNLSVGGSGIICSGTSTNITVSLSETGISYQLRDNAGNVNIGTPVTGTGGTIALPTGSLYSATVFNVLATNSVTSCSGQLNETESVTINPAASGGILTGGTSPVTYGSSTGIITLSGFTGTIVKWQKMVDSGSWEDILNTNTTYYETPVSVGTWQYRAMVTNGSCPISYSTPLTIIVQLKALTVTAANQTKAYGNGFTFLGTEFTVSGLVNNDAVSNVTLTSAGAPTTANVAGSPYAITVSSATGTGLNNYTISYTDGLFTVTKANQTITFPTIPNPSYGSADFNLSASSGSGLAVSFSGSNPAVATITSGIFHIAGAGTVVITASQPGNLNYNPAADVSQSLIVNKALLTFTANNKSRAYLTQNPALTYTVSGYLFSESQSVLDLLPTIQTTAVQSSNAGSYPITISGGSDNNYSYSFVAGTMTISKIPQTITVTASPEKLLVGDDYTLTATSTSGLPVLFESLNTALATINGNQLTGVAKGKVSLRAYHPGDLNYNAAEAFVSTEIYSTHKDIMHLFTPNNDGFNDFWELPDLAAWGKCDVKVFNRWGKLVFGNPDYNNLWDGTSDGNPLPEGPYYFIINTENAGIVKGTVNIVR